MLSQGHMCAPLYRHTSQVGPRFGIQGNLWSENDVIIRAPQGARAYP